MARTSWAKEEEDENNDDLMGALLVRSATSILFCKQIRRTKDPKRPDKGTYRLHLYMTITTTNDSSQWREQRFLLFAR